MAAGKLFIQRSSDWMRPAVWLFGRSLPPKAQTCPLHPWRRLKLSKARIRILWIRVEPLELLEVCGGCGQAFCLSCRQISLSAIMRQRRKTRLSTYFIPRKVIRKMAFTISSFSVELTRSPDYQSVSFPATERSWTFPSESLHSPNSPKLRFGRESLCCVSFFGRL